MAQGFEPLRQLLHERLNDVFVALEKMPLAVLLVGDQTGPLQRCQMGGNGRLRQAGALVDLAGTHTTIDGVTLIGESRTGSLSQSRISGEPGGRGL